MSAMLTQRKMFSSSFVISAARVEETGTTVSRKRLVERHGDLRATRRHAADDLGGVLGLVDGVARIDALGRERQMKVGPDLQAEGLQDRLDDLLGGTGIRRRLKRDQHLGRRYGAIWRAADSMKDVSGSFISSSGVGTQITIASHSPAREKSVVASMRPADDHLGEFVGGDVGDVAPSRR